MVKVEHISKALDKIDTIEEEVLQELLDNYAQEQEVVVNYILRTCESFQDEQIASLSMYYYAVFHESFINAKLNVKTLSEEELGIFLDKYLPILEQDDAEVMSNDMLHLIEQETLFSFLINELVVEDEEGQKMSDAEQQKLYILGTLMIGLLNHGAKA